MAERRSKQERSESPVAACEMPCETVKRIDRELNGNGQPGMRQELRHLADESHAFFTTAVTERAAEMAFHNKRDQEIKNDLAAHASTIKAALDAENTKTAKRSLLWQIAAVFVSVAAACVAALAIACTWYVSHHTALEPPEILRQLYTRQVLKASITQQQIAGKEW